MITKITIDAVASFKSLTTLETDKKINLIYGLNGTGKSTVANYLYNSEEDVFSQCSFEMLNDDEILVYNQQFVNDNFYESDKLKGIFTLSKENKEAEEKIKSTENEIQDLNKVISNKISTIENLQDEYEKKKTIARNVVWEIKTTYTGGDRILAFCLDGLKRKEPLLDYLSVMASGTPEKPNKDIDDLKRDLILLTGDNAKPYNTIPFINFEGKIIETHHLFLDEIIGNETSAVASLVNELDNADWLEKGLKYLPEEINDTAHICPFCQQKTITKTVVSNIKSYFDMTYNDNIHKLKELLSDYELAVNSLPPIEVYKSHPLLVDINHDFENQYNNLISLLRANILKIRNKIESPSQTVMLEKSSDIIINLNQKIEANNQEIQEHNDKISHRDKTLKEIKDTFWKIMGWEYRQTIKMHLKDMVDTRKKTEQFKAEIKSIEEQVIVLKKNITEEQNKTKNIDDAIRNINNSLQELGIDNFSIVKHSEIHYVISRDTQVDHTFHTLSEGEKMIISFLYFRELCEGKRSATSIRNKKIVVIDDPISSLSHIYIFNIGQMIKKYFFKSDNYTQVFVFTHSLYFFYELTDTNHDRREREQKLFRMIKNSVGSQILDMKYESIQNDYHAYWSIVNDEKQPPALIANCMRNIIEYFFNFIEKKDFNNVFQKPELQDNKYQAFRRYVDRESHSLGQNIFDIKEFDYNTFKEALELVFSVNGYQEHCKRMIK